MHGIYSISAGLFEVAVVAAGAGLLILATGVLL